MRLGRMKLPVGSVVAVRLIEGAVSLCFDLCVKQGILVCGFSFSRF